MSNLLWMQCFVRVVETGSFSAVARELGIGQPNVSRHIASLEDHLSVRLMHRTTRKLSLTPEGERYYAEVRRALDALTEAESVVRGDDVPRGRLRVACSISIGQWFVRPLATKFLEKYQEVELELVLSDEYVDLVAEGIDFALRVGTLKDSALKARRIGTSERACVATPNYLAKHPEPKTPDELLQHNCICYTLLSSGNVWTFGDTQVAVKGRFRVNSPEAIRAAVLDDLGIGYVPIWMVAKELQEGSVKALLTDYASPSGEIHLIYPAKKLLARRASLFMAALSEAFAAEPVLNEGSLARLLAGSRDDAKAGSDKAKARRK
jgi:DNA-binding transcriptional LysR family regulator